MTQAKTPARKLFVNLPVKDLARSKEFFAKLGFQFNAQFTDDSAACMVLSEDGYVMLLVEPRFRDFAKKPIGDAAKTTGSIVALSATDRAEVDKLADLALASGGSKAGEPMDHGFMYLRSFFDLDGYHWEVFFMDPSHVQK